MSLGCKPDCALCVWRWREEKLLASKAAPSPVNYQISFSQGDFTRLTACGPGHLTFWSLDGRFYDRLTHESGRFLLRPTASIESATENGSQQQKGQGKVISTTHWGNLLVWGEQGTIELEITRKDG